MQLNVKIREFAKQKGFYKLHLLKQMKQLGATKRGLLSNPSLIDPPDYKVTLIKKKKLSLVEIEKDMNEVYQ